MSDLDLAPGVVAWATLEPVRGREQGGRRPVLVIASTGYLDAVTMLVIVLPISTVDRGWPNCIAIVGPSGLDRPSWIMSEQPRTLSRDRITGIAGHVSQGCLNAIRLWLSDFLDL
ncbi:type II toxin-antitoxin system PemK/MazF family toxin [Glaciihabitans sp. GrIS 2.15]|uniref:type II toxin-antitoxin system PemK/MazF family toxin n=1 Tax=Glaciihabitans sp. GrIS 2.15 TaxID=3071710 RepID=UPI002E02C7C5|nr:mRNA interferase MazF [Glaciihabitans sp. GrIS 2.15]